MHVVRDDQPQPPQRLATLNDARLILDQLFKPVREQLDKYYIPDHLVNNVIDHAINQIVRNRDIKPEKVVRRTVAHFKLKLLHSA